MKNSIILAVLLVPSFGAAQNKAEEKEAVIYEMCTLMLKMMRTHHAMIVSIWASGFDDALFSEKMRQEGMDMYEQAGQLLNRMEALSHE